MTKKTFTVTEKEEETLNKLIDFFNEKTLNKTMSRIIEFCERKLLK